MGAWRLVGSRAAGCVPADHRVDRLDAAVADERPAFVTETQPWLDSASAWGQSPRAALRMLQSECAGDRAAALADRQQAESLMAQAKSYHHATAYKLQTSSDGLTWTDAADVSGSQGGTETVSIDQQIYLPMQGVQRATQYGYSIYELQAYPIAQRPS